MANWLDTAIAFFAPSAGAKRLRSRMLMSAYQFGERKYEAAGRGRRTADWKATASDANAEIEGSLSTLRARSRQMVRDNGYAFRASEVIPANVVGTGIRPSLSMTGKSKRKLDRVKAEWKAWADDASLCDHDGNLSFYGLQELVTKSLVESGEVLLRRIYVEGQRIPFQIQVLEADHLDGTRDGQNIDGGGYIEMGIQFDSRGKRTGYWLFQTHPGSNRQWRSLESVFIPARDIIHVYHVRRPGQVRGVPFGVASMIRLRDFDEFEDAELVKQKVAACFAAFVETPEDAPAAVASEDEIAPSEKLEPGMIEYLQPGKKISFGAPPVHDTFDTYSRRTLQGVAAGYGLTYEALTNDLSNVNFSSGRMGWIEFGKLIKKLQNDVIITKMCAGVWRWFSDAGIITGLMTPGDGISVEWTAPRREMIDPQKETKGLSELVRNGFDSWQNVVRQQGLDPEVLLAQMIEDSKAFDANDLMPVSDPRFDPNRKDPTADGATLPQKKQKNGQ